MRVSNAKYTPEYRANAVKLVLEDGFAVTESAKRLAMPKQTLDTWVRQARAGKSAGFVKLSAEAVEIARLKKQLALAEMERDILKKATAYFARESVQGTRL